MEAREIMACPVVTVRRDTPLVDAARLLLDNQFGCLPVIEESGELCGILTNSDFAAKERGVPFSTLLLPQVFNDWLPPDGVEEVYRAARATAVESVMTQDPITVAEEAPVGEVIRRMLYRRIHHIPVVRDGVPVGIISRHDLLRMMVDAVGGADGQAAARPAE